MADQKTTDAALTNLVVTYYEKVGLERLLPKLRFYQFGDKKPLPSRSGKTIQWYRFRTQTAVTSNMTELTAPTQVYLSADTVTATLVQRGAYVKVSDLLIMTAIDPILQDAAILMGEKAARTVDTYVRDQIGFHLKTSINRSSIYVSLLSSGIDTRIWSGPIPQTRDSSSVMGFRLLQNNTSNGGSALVQALTTSAITVKNIQNAAMFLRNSDADAFDDGYYVGIIHPKVAYNLMISTGWKGWQQYTSPELMYKGEIGRVGGVRFVESTDAPAFQLTGDNLGSTSGSVFGTIIFGKHAYGVTEIAGQGNKQKGYELYVKQLGSAGTADPVNQQATAGFKITMAAKILNKSAGVIVVTNNAQ